MTEHRQLIEEIKNLLDLYDKDGQDGYSAFSIDPNERIENLRKYVDVYST